MLSKISINAYLSLLLTTLLLTTKPCFAINSNSFAEYTNSINTATFSSIKTIGLFARGQMTQGEIVYGGLKFSHFDLSNGIDSSSLYQVVIGASITGTYAPFLEIGTDFISFFGSRDNSDCGSGKECQINAFIKAGIRIRLPEGYTLGIFHESMTFENNNSVLSGDHNYIGMSIGYHF